MTNKENKPTRTNQKSKSIDNPILLFALGAAAFVILGLACYTLSTPPSERTPVQGQR